MVLGNPLIDSFFKMKAIRTIEEAVYNACSNGLDHIRLNVTFRVTNTQAVDLSMLYLELIEMLQPVYFEFFEKTLSTNKKEKWLLVQLDLKSERIKQCYAERLQIEVMTKQKKIRNKTDYNESKYLNMFLNELNKNELQRLVDDYDESVELYKYRKAHKISFKRFRLLVKDYLKYEVRWI